ncbi:NUDIX hydrolase [Oceaniglobus ichthyenteri]|uniref:NUDIX hydrolase n=1 Tax=Oceaniglobus ichthyenteri TaxID=2136177 RepID=UPI000D3A7458|nr:NUDIX hydrolase [Oceaniglobus ichthyenteri]
MSKESVNQLDLKPDQKREVRTQFGALCWRRHNGEVQVLLITTRRTKRWIVPKGWPMGGETPAGAAAVEAFEEAGVEGKLYDTCLGMYAYTKEMEGDDLPCVVAVFPLKVTKKHKDWPEAHERTRQWFSPKKAAQLVQEPELKRILRTFDPKTLV